MLQGRNNAGQHTQHGKVAGPMPRRMAPFACSASSPPPPTATTAHTPSADSERAKHIGKMSASVMASSMVWRSV
jgi:hypothetical protein